MIAQFSEFLFFWLNSSDEKKKKKKFDKKRQKFLVGTTSMFVLLAVYAKELSTLLGRGWRDGVLRDDT